MKLKWTFLLSSLCSILFLGCSRSKSTSPNLEDWLETNFPGRFEVLRTDTVDPIRHLTFKIKESVVAERSDRRIQGLIRVDLRAPNLDLLAEDVEMVMQRAKVDLQAADRILPILKQAGFEKISLRVQGRQLQLFDFEEPTQEVRSRVLKTLIALRQSHKDLRALDWQVGIAEPDQYGKEFQEVIEPVQWQSCTITFTKQVIANLTISAAKESSEDSPPQWEFNSFSQRLDSIFSTARSSAKEWASANLKQPVTILRVASYQSLPANPMDLELQFTFANGEIDDSQDEYEGPIAGRLVTTYFFDKKEFTTFQTLAPDKP